jgi:hypothetical protein
MRRVVSLAIFHVVLISCHKESAHLPQTKPDDAISLPLADTTRINDTTIFFDVVLGGQRQLQIQPLNNYSVYWAGSVPYISGSYGLYEQGITGNVNQGLVLFNGISAGPNDTSLVLKNERMFNGFEPGLYSYTQDPNNNSGVQIHWIDPTGKTWSTNLGVADQSGSAFQIINRVNLDTSYNTTGITHSIYIRCSFNCTLYDNTGKILELKNGRLGISVWL